MPTQVHRTEVDGIPCVVAEEPGPARCALVFRVGSADETLVTSGVTHLVEHLVMHAVGRPPHDANAFVDPVRTVFWAAGQAEEVVAFVRSVTAALAALPLDRLELERRVLLTEAARRASGAAAEMLAYRFGPRTYGLRAYDEHGLRQLDDDAVGDWARTRFTRAGLAVWSTVPLPDDVRFALPDGVRRLPPEPHAVDPLPVRAGTRTALGMDVVAPRSLALGTATRLLRHRLHDALRREHAVVYDVGADTERVGADARRFVLLTDPLPELRYRAGQLLVQTVERLLDEGFTEEEVRADTAAAVRTWDEPGAAAAFADGWAFDTLVDRPLRTVDELREEQQALTAEAATTALREAFGSALLAVPDEVVTSVPVGHVPLWSADRVQGRTFLPVEPTAAQRLVVGAGGVTYEAGDRHPVTVELARCEAVLAWDDGTRRLLGSDGFQVAVAPWEWQDGAQAVADVDRAVEPGLVVRMGPGGGAPRPRPAPEPAAPADTGPPWGWVGFWVFLSLVSAQAVAERGRDAGRLALVLAVGAVVVAVAVVLVQALRRRRATPSG